MNPQDANAPAPTVGQANSSLRAVALDAAWWLNHYANQSEVTLSMTASRQGMARLAKQLDAAVKASNDALDREAFNV
jgi:hypothetical protein